MENIMLLLYSQQDDIANLIIIHIYFVKVKF